MSEIIVQSPKNRIKQWYIFLKMTLNNIYTFSGYCDFCNLSFRGCFLYQVSKNFLGNIKYT